MRVRLIIVLGSAGYALVRYVRFAPELSEHIPAFVINKAISMAAPIFLVLAVIARWKSRAEVAGRYLEWAGFCVHVPLSLVLLRPGYFSEFFESDLLRLRTMAEVVVLFGAVSFALMWFVSSRRRSLKERAIAGSALLATALCHVLAMGICRGLNINAKHPIFRPCG